MKNKTTAGILALIFGSLGMHKFYLNKPAQGIFYLCFAWTAIPLIISIIEGIKFLRMDKKKFNKIYN